MKVDISQRRDISKFYISIQNSYFFGAGLLDLKLTVLLLTNIPNTQAAHSYTLLSVYLKDSTYHQHQHQHSKQHEFSCFFHSDATCFLHPNPRKSQA